MKYLRMPRFKSEFRKFPKEVQNAFEKQITFLLQDIRHPSLRAKKYDEGACIWHARVTKNVRFYFRITEDTYELLNIRKHKD